MQKLCTILVRNSQYLTHAWLIDYLIDFSDVLSSLPQQNEFSMLISSDAEDQYEYAAGLVFLGAFWMVFFVMWAFGLIVCKWLGSAQVGFMSGSAMKPPGPEAKRLIQKKQPIIIRSIFACCALLWIIFTIVFLAVGLGAISDFDAAMKTGSNVSVLWCSSVRSVILGRQHQNRTIANSWCYNWYM